MVAATGSPQENYMAHDSSPDQKINPLISCDVNCQRAEAFFIISNDLLRETVGETQKTRKILATDEIVASVLHRSNEDTTPTST